MLDQTNTDLVTDALDGLRAPQKWLSPKWFYDDAGSAIFEQITDLPEYYPTRTEAAILRDHAAALAALVPGGGALVELGSGASVKTRTLLDAGSHFGAYVPIDISEGFLLDTAGDLMRRYPDLSIHPVVGDFTGPVDLPDAVAGASKVGFFPGSTIGNLDPEAAIDLLARARAWPDARHFILGADLVKEVPTLVAAYDDAAGVTAAFNRNVLHRLNREAGANFDVAAFAHEARWCDDPARIEMHLVATRAMQVTLGPEVIHFANGESIHTESCRKYTPDTLGQLAEAAGWGLAELLTDEQDRFAVAILQA
ncbi:dimethylhistidine N-methyltransferase [Jannaschia pagri]|uniref:Dimethylhistidine N-methyltransferase n=1 Tax=Jannaschia pagri TaxID=2829797 RepID=A0ABQ4NIS9_9RHOB|nr:MULTISPECIES: L-histidine N(alpha)-methyltransferase [unclassified Jannaschia]GIT89574.1 dimethylhistidine N-methyltransferase [Jannaschia sp. AI_61]GIT94318.1 dimethylhistidine N-methyltransferase [Jannaschia sp. AI_62]